MSRSLQEAIPNSKLTVIPGARHLTPVQCPREIAGLLTDLIGRSAGASA
jgi:pimeloyl-ACP methyl ester carboxylesterase